MAKKMTWDERYQMHLDLWREHFQKAKEAIHSFVETGDFEYFYEYEREYHEAQKHYGVSSAMYTRRYRTSERRA